MHGGLSVPGWGVVIIVVAMIAFAFSCFIIYLACFDINKWFIPGGHNVWARKKPEESLPFHKKTESEQERVAE